VLDVTDGRALCFRHAVANLWLRASIINPGRRCRFGIEDASLPSPRFLVVGVAGHCCQCVKVRPLRRFRTGRAGIHGPLLKKRKEGKTIKIFNGGGGGRPRGAASFKPPCPPPSKGDHVQPLGGQFSDQFMLLSLIG